MSKDTDKIKDLSLEEGFEKIDELISEMQSEDISLVDSFEKYKYGMELVKHCYDQIDNVEKELKVLSELNE